MSSRFVERLRDPEPLIAVELRPPRSGLGRGGAMETWIDLSHAIRRLAAHDTPLLLTDNAVGEAEEENLRHLATNLAGLVDPRSVVPFLTCKHPLRYCLTYAERARAHGIEALTVVGGDTDVGPPRCVPHSHQLRERIRARLPGLALGGWANPHRGVSEQLDLLLEPRFEADYYLTQIVSHHDRETVERWVAEAERRGLGIPGMFGVFLYRSPNRAVLERLSEYFPVPVEAVLREFGEGASAEEICARTVVALRRAGARHVFLSNLGERGAPERYRRVLEAVATLS